MRHSTLKEAKLSNRETNDHARDLKCSELTCVCDDMLDLPPVPMLKSRTDLSEVERMILGASRTSQRWTAITYFQIPLYKGRIFYVARFVVGKPDREIGNGIIADFTELRTTLH